jgi:hypothetical protein
MFNGPIGRCTTILHAKRARSLESYLTGVVPLKRENVMETLNPKVPAAPRLFRIKSYGLISQPKSLSVFFLCCVMDED